MLPEEEPAGRVPRLRRLSRLSQGVAGAAVLIGAVTVVARGAGFGRYLVFSHTVGQGCLGTVYTTANLLPTVVFDAVVGGALASVVVPVLSGPVSRAAGEEARRTASALLTWTVAVLLPLAVAGVLVARPVVGLLLGDVGGCARGPAIAAGTLMLLIFLPQLVLYGVTVVLSGLLQAHRRFLGPALAPLASSLVVITTYLVFAAVAGADRRGGVADLAELGTAPLLVLAVGTTLGVAALTLTVVAPAARTRLRLRPTFTFPPGVARRARALAAAGAATLLAHQVVVIAVVRLANAQGVVGSVALYTYAWQLFLLPFAVLALPIATSAFPTLSARAAGGDQPGYAATAARTTRAVVLVCCAAAAALAAAAGPVSRVFLLGTPGDVDPTALARAVVAFAPGLVGYGLVALASRALYASGHTRASATAVVSGWAAVLAADVGLAVTVPPEWVVAAFGIGNSVGMTLAGALLLGVLHRTGGRQAVAGAGRAVAAGTLGGLGGYAAGAGVVAALGPLRLWGSVGLCVLGALASGVAFAALAVMVDAPDTRAVAARWLMRGWPR